MRLDRWEWVTLLTVAFGAAFVATMSWNVDKRTLEQVGDARWVAEAWWTGLVQSGIPPDSATQLTLNALRSRLNGSRAKNEYPFVSSPIADSVWQAFHLNPFLKTNAQAARNARERESMRLAKEDIRLVLAVGTAEGRRREVARTHRVQVILITGLAILSIGTLLRRRNLRRQDRLLASLGGWDR